MPEHEPQVGQAERSITCTSSSVTRSSAAAIIASTRSTFLIRSRAEGGDLAGLHRPAGDEDHRDVERKAAISMPGVILSQFEMHTMASAQCALTMYSTESAIRSRDGSE